MTTKQTRVAATIKALEALGALERQLSHLREALGHPVDADKPFVDLARDGYHRIGRIDEVGRRSLWLREERHAIELRAGREGDDARVRITDEHPLFSELKNVLSYARFAAEWEQEGGWALDTSYELDEHPDSIYRRRRDHGLWSLPGLRLGLANGQVVYDELTFLISPGKERQTARLECLTCATLIHEATAGLGERIWHHANQHREANGRDSLPWPPSRT